MTKTEPESVHVAACGCSVKMMRAGSGPPLLLLRGTDASDLWLPYMDKLAERFDVIVPEHPGFGGASLPPWLDRVSDLANFYLDLADQLQLTSVHVVGTGLGGWIAADLAHRNCQRLATLTLVGAAGLRLPDVAQLDVFLRNEEQALGDWFHDRKAAASAIERMLSPETEDVRLSNAIAVARVAWQPRLHDPHLIKWLHRISVPTLLLWGEHDRLFPVSHAEAYRNRIPDARLKVVPQCGHAVALEQPDVLVETLVEFIAGRTKTA